MQKMHGWKRGARALTAAVLILAATLLALPGSASAGGRGHAWGRHRIAGYGGARVYRPRYRYHSYYAYGYRPYYVSYYRPRYRAVIVDDPYCYDDDYYIARPVYRTYHHRSRPRVAVSLSFGSPGVYYGDPYCGW